MSDIVKINSKMLKGRVCIPSSKSIAHRVIIASALSGGECRLDNITMNEDIKATIRCIRSLGAKCSVNIKEKAVKISPKKAVKAKGDMVLDCGESGSTLRFLLPLALLQDRPVKFIGCGRLMERPLTPYLEIFNKIGIKHEIGDDFIRVKGHLKAGVYELPGDVSSQFVTGLMLALPLLEGNSKIVISSPLESKGYVDITIDVLKSFGISIKNKGYSEFIIKGGQKYKPTDYKVEGDYSQAAFFLVAGALGCDIVCDNLRENSVQGDKKILDIIDKLGGKIRKLDDGGICAVRTDVMHGGVIDARDIPDLVPIIAVLCSFCRGESRIINAGRLRLKESDRLLAISTELKRLGVNIIEGSDSLKIVGGDLLVPNTVSAWNDHRIVMAIAIGACRTEGSIEIVGAEAAVQKSYPEFFEVYKNLTDWI